jgi:DNA-binding NarL/FixJ family response regulator
MLRNDITLATADFIMSASCSSPPAANRSRRIRVLLADDHKVMREILSLLLGDEPDIEVVGEAADGAAAVEMASEHHPDIVIMDVTMPCLNGIDATRRITSHMPDVHVIGLSMHEREDMAASMLRAGACAYLSKDGPTDDLIAAIRSAC